MFKDTVSPSGRCAPTKSISHSHNSRRTSSIVCMAHPRRVAKVSSQIQREIGDMFVSDQVLAIAICPERHLGDNSLTAVASVTHTYVSNDLQVVKIYVSIYSDDKGKKRAMDNLKRLEPYVRREIGQRVPMRLTPDIRFEYDDSIEEMELVQKVLGPEEVARFTKELDKEFGGSGSRVGGAEVYRAPWVSRREEEDSRFFDEVDDEELEDWNDDRQVFPNPFEDLFTGKGEQMATIRKDFEGKKGGKWTPDSNSRQ
ncbi:MAG: hypothetical protein WDW36_007702 [Sanguina aurantia]